MTFDDDDLTDETKEQALYLLRMQKTMDVLHACSMELCDGELPADLPNRMGLLFASVAKLAIQSVQAREKAIESFELGEQEADESLDAMLNGICKCSAIVAIRFAEEELKDPLPSFSDN